MVIVVLLDGARCPAKCSLRLPKAGRVSDLVRVSYYCYCCLRISARTSSRKCVFVFS